MRVPAFLQAPGLALFALVAAAEPAVAQSGNSCSIAPPRQFGDWQLMGEDCDASYPTMATASSCQQLRIRTWWSSTEDPDLISVDLLISEPAVGTTPRGTVLLGTGGYGLNFFAATAEGAIVANTLTAYGFRVVQRRWDVAPNPGAYGWFGGDIGVLRGSLRYATLLQYVYDEFHDSSTPEPNVFAVVGTSAGASEIGYALSSWDMASLIDVAVLVSGPPMTRLDLLCELGGAAWASCAGTLPPNVMACSPPDPLTCSHPGGGPFNTCTACSVAPDGDSLRDDSILHLSAVTDYDTGNPATTPRVHMLLGTEDCDSGAPAMANLLYEAIDCEKALQFIDGAQHALVNDVAGQDAIVNAVLAGTSNPASPATLTATSWPLDGEPFDVEIHGPAFGRAHIQVSFSMGPPTLVPDLGWSFLDQATTFVMRTLILDSEGRGTITVAGDDTEGLQGTEIFLQGWLQDSSFNDVAYTNFTSFVVR